MVHIHAEGPAFFAWLPKMFGKRVVVTVHGIDWQREKWQSGLGSKFIHQGEKNAAKYADEVIVLSKGVQKYFLETYGRETRAKYNWDEVVKETMKEGAKMAEKKFIPVKVTDREWAEKLLDGEVFMRPLYEFGAWNLKKEDKQLNNSFRGDLCEGMSGIFGEVEECQIYDSFDENVKKYIKQIWYSLNGEDQYAVAIVSLFGVQSIEELDKKVKEAMEYVSIHIRFRKKSLLN